MDSDPLTDIKFLGNKTIISLDSIETCVREDDYEEVEEIEDEYEFNNPRAPTI